MAIIRLCLSIVSCCLLLANAHAAEPSVADGDSAAPKLKVLYVTGGGYHKYEDLTPIITRGIAKHANVAIDVVWGLDPLREKTLGEGYDAVIYSVCFQEKDVELVENARRVTREGKPTVLVHCTMHSFRWSEDWTDCCGMRTRQHDPYRSFKVEKVNADHPAVKHFPAEWTTEGDELYQTIKFPDTSTALLKGIDPKSGKEHIVAWSHTYGNGRVFGSTLGHDMKTVERDEYHSLLAHGLLWACDALDADGNPKPGYEGQKPSAE